MSRTLGGPLASHLATRSHTRATMLRLDLIDGTAIGITDHDVDLAFDLGDGEITYDSGTGILTSDVVLACGLDADNYEFQGPIVSAGPVTREAVLGGRFNRARARLFEVNWKSLGSGAIKLLAGTISEMRLEGGRFVAEVRSDCDLYNQTVGNLIVNQCSGDHATCCVSIGAELATTVTAVASAMQFTVAGPLTDRHFPGKLWFTSGDLLGTEPVELHSRSGNVVTLFRPFAEAPQVGDALIVKEGCNRTREMCRERFNNVINMRRAYPEVPGSDQVLRPGIPGEG